MKKRIVVFSYKELEESETHISRLDRTISSKTSKIENLLSFSGMLIKLESNNDKIFIFTLESNHNAKIYI